MVWSKMLRIDDAMLRRQLEFLVELDRLKSVVRQSWLADRSRRENSAEHSWHIAVFALVLAGHASDIVDVSHFVRLLLVNDIVEIDAGDTPIHLASARADLLEAAEKRAAQRLFGLLPNVQRAEFEALWLEFEGGMTAEARFARALDRMQPLLLNLLTDGGTWKEAGVTEVQVIQRYGPAIAAGSPELWSVVRALVRRHFDERTAAG